ncbi:MAG: DUF1116 domain-containing protein, partial [Burkholderiales bacterium]|nr:DUF1116 domain-containing protein [Burkholderiales bacterium]
MTGPDPESEARRRIAALRPACVGVARVGELIGSAKRRVVFHAGPPFESAAEIPQPVRHSIAVAALRESWATDFESAERLLSAGAIETAAAQDHGLLVPLAGVLSPAMAVLTVRDLDGSSTVHVALNEGQQHATRLGLADPELPRHLRWLDEEFAPWLGERFASPLELAPAIAQALAEGDDCHARSVAGSRWIGRWLAQTAPLGSESTAALRFVDESPAFALNFWMGAAALWLRAAEGVAGCTWLSRAGGNGLRF